MRTIPHNNMGNPVTSVKINASKSVLPRYLLRVSASLLAYKNEKTIAYGSKVSSPQTKA
jgi:hypothetical protein